jgi:ATP-binding cassette subfamily F protein uup
VATRIVELDRGSCAATPATSAAYEAARPTSWQKRRWPTRADKLLAQEEVWIRKGVEARRTRSVAACAAGAAAPRARARAATRRGKVRLEVDAGAKPARSWPS